MIRRNVTAAASRFRILTNRLLARLGLKDDAFLVVLAVVIGVVTAAAAVSFHLLIDVIRHALYQHVGPQVDLYGKGLWMLVLIPAAGGLAVGVISNHILRVRAGKGLIDVLEQVSRSNGVIDPLVALEKIVTSAITIGTGGSAGAEGPIVQIGAGIASGIGQLFRVARQHMPVLIGCGSAAGISAIFNSPLGGVLFTLEVVLRDFSIRTFTPVVVASVLANFATQAIFRNVLDEPYVAIFTLPESAGVTGFQFQHLGQFALLGVVCGLVGVTFIRLMHYAEEKFAHLDIPKALKPAIGGAGLGLLGVVYILTFGKVIDTHHYAMPAFFGDGYGAVQPLFSLDFYQAPGVSWGKLFSILVFFIVAKLLGTAASLGSGGSGGIIAPSLFLGAVTGGALGMLLQKFHLIQNLDPHAYALVGIGGVLAAVIHAPLASTLILFEVTRDYQVTLPAMLACIVATGTARLLFRDSIYTLGLRQRGVRVGTSGDLRLLQRLNVEQVSLDPATTLRDTDPLQHALDLLGEGGTIDFVVLDQRGTYVGMLTGEEIKSALIQREAIPLLVVAEVMRADVPLVSTTDDLAAALDLFGAHDVGHLPVTVSRSTGRIIGVLSRSALMRRYRQALDEA
jgi:CIC family chloride channel protein